MWCDMDREDNEGKSDPKWEQSLVAALPWENEQSRPYVKGREVGAVVWLNAQQLDFQQKDLCESSRAWQGGTQTQAV